MCNWSPHLIEMKAAQSYSQALEMKRVAIDKGESRFLSALQKTASSGSNSASIGSATGPDEAAPDDALSEAGEQQSMDVDAAATLGSGAASSSRQRRKSASDERPPPLPSDDEDMPLAARRRHTSAPQERGAQRRKGGTPKRRRSPSPSFVSKLAKKKHKGKAQDSDVEEVLPGEESGEETEAEAKFLREGLEKMIVPDIK